MLSLLPLLVGCAWLESARECQPACEKVFDESQCGIHVGVIDHTAITGCVTRCGEQDETTRTEWIYCVAGADCHELEEGECLYEWVLGGASTGGGGEQIPIDTGSGW